MLAREYERVVAGRPPVPFDSSRYSIDMVPPHRRDDQNLWKQTLQKNQRLLQYEVVRYHMIRYVLCWRIANGRCSALCICSF